MSVEYDAVGGIGIEFTDKMVNIAIKNEIFTKENWEEYVYECLDTIGLIYQQAGNTYIEESIWYLFVKGKTLREINDNSESFIKRLAEIGILVDIDELKVIEDIYIW